MAQFEALSESVGVCRSLSESVGVCWSVGALSSLSGMSLYVGYVDMSICRGLSRVFLTYLTYLDTDGGWGQLFYVDCMSIVCRSSVEMLA